MRFEGEEGPKRRHRSLTPNSRAVFNNILSEDIPGIFKYIESNDLTVNQLNSNMETWL